MTEDEAEDIPDHDPAERKMRFLFALRSRGVTDPRVLQSMERIDRGAFVTGIFAERAYEDVPLPIACGQTISQPSVVGLMTQALNVGARDKVLEIGTGSGYQAAVLSQLARRVYTVDRHRRLVREERRRLLRLQSGERARLPFGLWMQGGARRRPGRPVLRQPGRP